MVFIIMVKLYRLFLGGQARRRVRRSILGGQPVLYMNKFARLQTLIIHEPITELLDAVVYSAAATVVALCWQRCSGVVAPPPLSRCIELIDRPIACSVCPSAARDSASHSQQLSTPHLQHLAAQTHLARDLRLHAQLLFPTPIPTAVSSPGIPHKPQTTSLPKMDGPPPPPPPGPSSAEGVLARAFRHIDLEGHDLPPSPAPSSPRNGKRYAMATELVYTEHGDQYNSSSMPIYQVTTTEFPPHSANRY